MAGGYAGDVSVKTAWAFLKDEAGCQLVDVRTTPEWLYVGVPDLRTLKKKAILCEWQSYPSLTVSPGFIETIQKRYVQEGEKILFLCRSGQRSAAAALALTQAGTPHCYNIAQGFEGPLDSQGHRSSSLSWKGAGLPWRQDITLPTETAMQP